MSESTRVASVPIRAAGWRETTILLTTAWLVPFLVHLLPWSGHRPLGVYVLPVFWTTFVALYFRGAVLGLLVGLVTPLINLAITGLPVSTTIGSMALEVFFFTLAAVLLVRRWPGLWITAPVAWIIGKGLAIVVQNFIPAFAEYETPWAHLARSTQNGLAGLAVLAVINVLLVKFYPKTDAWEKE